MQSITAPRKGRCVQPQWKKYTLKKIARLADFCLKNVTKAFFLSWGFFKVKKSQLLRKDRNVIPELRVFAFWIFVPTLQVGIVPRKHKHREGNVCLYLQYLAQERREAKKKGVWFTPECTWNPSGQRHELWASRWIPWPQNFAVRLLASVVVWTPLGKVCLWLAGISAKECVRISSAATTREDV